jgi:hypothetical protein
MMKLEKISEYLKTAVMVLFVIGVLWNAMVMTYGLFHPGPEQKVQLEVTGIINSTNATTLTSLHYECIKFCQSKFHGEYEKLNDCWKQCSSLGKEMEAVNNG